MKAFLLSLLVMISVNCFGQNLESKTFNFDYQISYTIKNEKRIIDKSVLINSEDSSYYMLLSKIDNEILAEVILVKDKRKNIFVLNQKNDNFDFRYSTKINNYSGHSHHYIMNILDNGTVELLQFRNKKKTKLEESQVLTFTTSEKPLFFAYIYAIYNVQDVMGINFSYSENIIVKEANVECGNGLTAKITLKEVKKINLKL
ncbi:hypothetical protein [Epilithonimonas sp.]|uniref:hypothetical protein n=1 Tax=Epilithonimonas sp. TaxID=2894511 RepID=UPI002FDD3ABF